MLWCRWWSPASTISALARLSTAVVPAAPGSIGGEIRFGQLGKQARQNRRSSPQPSQQQSKKKPSQALGRAHARSEQRQQQAGRFEFGALACRSSLVDPAATSIEMDLQLEEAANAMADKAADERTVVIDEDKRPSHRPLAREGRKHDEAWYLRSIDKLAEANDIAGIVRLLHRDMLGEDRYLSTRQIMHSVMRHLASVGAYEEAKAVFNRCCSAGVEPNYVTHCHYLNALAKAPIQGRPDSGAGELAYRHYHALCLESNNTGLHRFVYYFAVLACARNGLVQEALKIFDDSVTIGQQHPLPQMLDALLQACYTDKTAGTAIALLIWRRYRLAFGGRLNFHHYYRMLRCLRACGLGPPHLLAGAEVAAGPLTRAALSASRSGDNGAAVAIGQLQDGWSAALSAESVQQKQLQTSREQQSPLPQIDFRLPAQPPAALALSCPISLLRPRQAPPLLEANALQLPWQRLVLVGGISGFVEAMRADQAELTPAIVLDLIELLPPIPEAELMLMRICRGRGLHRAMDGSGSSIYNALLRYRVRNHLDCSDVLDEMRSVGHQFNRDTYVALAAASDCEEAGERLLADMARDSARPDQSVFYAMLTASAPADLAYKAWLVRRMTGFDVPPSPAIIRRMEKDLALCRSSLARSATAAPASASALAPVGSSSEPPLLVDAKEFQSFRLVYESWLKVNRVFSSGQVTKLERLRLKHERLKSLKQ